MAETARAMIVEKRILIDLVRILLGIYIYIYYWSVLEY